MARSMRSLDERNFLERDTFNYPLLPFTVEFNVFVNDHLIELGTQTVTAIDNLPTNGATVGYWRPLVACRLLFDKPDFASSLITGLNYKRNMITNSVVNVCEIYYDTEAKSDAISQKDDPISKYLGINLPEEIGTVNHWGYSFFGKNCSGKVIPQFSWKGSST